LCQLRDIDPSGGKGLKWLCVQIVVNIIYPAPLQNIYYNKKHYCSGLLCLLEMVFDDESTNSNFFLDKLWLCGWPHSRFNNRFNSISITDK